MRSTFGLYLKTLRKQRGISQVELAKKLKFKTSQSISNIERGVSPMPASHIKRLAKALKVPAFEFATKAGNAARAEYLKKAGIYR